MADDLSDVSTPPPDWVGRLTDQVLGSRNSFETMLRSLLTEAACRENDSLAVSDGAELFTSAYAERRAVESSTATVARDLRAAGHTGARRLVGDEAIRRVAVYNRSLAALISECMGLERDAANQARRKTSQAVADARAAKTAAAAAEAAAETHKAELASAVATVNQLEQQLQRLHAGLDTGTGTPALSTRDESARDEIDGLRDECLARAEETKAETARAGALFVQLHAVRNQLESSSVRIMELETELANSTNENNDLRRRNAQIAAEAANGWSETEKLEAQLAAAKHAAEMDLESRQILLVSVMEEARETMAQLRKDKSIGIVSHHKERESGQKTVRALGINRGVCTDRVPLVEAGTEPEPEPEHEAQVTASAKHTESGNDVADSASKPAEQQAQKQDEDDSELLQLRALVGRLQQRVVVLNQREDLLRAELAKHSPGSTAQNTSELTSPSPLSPLSPAPAPATAQLVEDNLSQFGTEITLVDNFAAQSRQQEVALGSVKSDLEVSSPATSAQCLEQDTNVSLSPSSPPATAAATAPVTAPATAAAAAAATPPAPTTAFVAAAALADAGISAAELQAALDCENTVQPSPASPASSTQHGQPLIIDSEVEATYQPPATTSAPASTTLTKCATPVQDDLQAANPQPHPHPHPQPHTLQPPQQLHTAAPASQMPSQRPSQAPSQWVSQGAESDAGTAPLVEQPSTLVVCCAADSQDEITSQAPGPMHLPSRCEYPGSLGYSHSRLQVMNSVDDWNDGTGNANSELVYNSSQFVVEDGPDFESQKTQATPKTVDDRLAESISRAITEHRAAEPSSAMYFDSNSDFELSAGYVSYPGQAPPSRKPRVPAFTQQDVDSVLAISLLQKSFLTQISPPSTSMQLPVLVTTPRQKSPMIDVQKLSASPLAASLPASHSSTLSPKPEPAWAPVAGAPAAQMESTTSLSTQVGAKNVIQSQSGFTRVPVSPEPQPKPQPQPRPLVTLSPSITKPEDINIIEQPVQRHARQQSLASSSPSLRTLEPCATLPPPPPPLEPVAPKPELVECGVQCNILTSAASPLDSRYLGGRPRLPALASPPPVITVRNDLIASPSPRMQRLPALPAAAAAAREPRREPALSVTQIMFDMPNSTVSITGPSFGRSAQSGAARAPAGAAATAATTESCVFSASPPSPQRALTPPAAPLATVVSKLAAGGKVMITGDGRLDLTGVAETTPADISDTRLRDSTWVERRISNILDLAPAPQLSARPVPLPPAASLLWKYARNEFGISRLALKTSYVLSISAAAHADDSPACALFTRFLGRGGDNVAPGTNDMLAFWVYCRSILGFGLSIGQMRGRCEFYNSTITANVARSTTRRIFPSLQPDEVESVLNFARSLSCDRSLALAVARGHNVTSSPAAVVSSAVINADALLLAWFRLYELHRVMCVSQLETEFHDQADSPPLSEPRTLTLPAAVRAVVDLTAWLDTDAEKVITSELGAKDEYTAVELAQMCANFDLIRTVVLPGLTRPSGMSF